VKTRVAESPTVLVVDDEAPLREIARRILEREGYTVLEASNGMDAIAELEKAPAIDLLIADLQMPELPGEEMARRCRAAFPDLKVLYVSGVIDRLLNERPVLWQDEAFLEKPFTAAGLREAVALLLYGRLSKP
jgi:two-component system, cell cycle sensor histidine kinase and response regulator CckA